MDNNNNTTPDGCSTGLNGCSSILYVIAGICGLVGAIAYLISLFM